MGFSCRIRGPGRWNPSLRRLLMTAACLCLRIQQTSGAEAITATVGETVTITAPISENIFIYAWYRGKVVTNAQAILTYFGPDKPQAHGLQYTDRETGLPDGSLQIRDVLTNYTGNYTVNITPDGGTAKTVTRQLSVYEKVSKPIVRINVSQLIENKPVALTCENSNNAITILWFFRNSPLHPDNNRMTLSEDNRTLTISRVSRSDDGSYQCEAQNPVSKNTSDPLTVTVFYGPDNLVIEPSQNVEITVGNELRLTCTAASYPAAQYQWLRNNTSLNNTHSTYTKTSTTYEDSGTYTCVASNNVTGLSAIVFADIKISEFGWISGGAIAGIVIAVVVLLAIIIILIWYFCFKRPASGAWNGAQTEMNGTAAASNPNAPASGKAHGPPEDIQYTTVKFAPKADKVAKPAAPEGTVYSEVRRK